MRVLLCETPNLTGFRPGLFRMSFEGLAICEHGIEKYLDGLINYSMISFPSPPSQSLESSNNRPAHNRRTK